MNAIVGAGGGVVVGMAGARGGMIVGGGGSSAMAVRLASSA
ncbi:hypothetical protein [Variovorax sp. HW608]|nr:hypothetical protein [Variovorax sp. HW608]